MAAELEPEWDGRGDIQHHLRRVAAWRRKTMGMKETLQEMQPPAPVPPAAMPYKFEEIDRQLAALSKRLTALEQATGQIIQWIKARPK